MSDDPFADGMPVGDYHHWERVRGADCPDCECCTAALCEKAINEAGACHHYGGGSDFNLASCPCWRR